MSCSGERQRRINHAVDRQGAVALLRQAIGHDSVTGNEAAFAGFLAHALAELGATGVTVRDFVPGRPNVWGVRPGQGGGPRLLLIGHTDTVHVRGWREHWRGDPRENPFAAPVIDGEIWGRGSGDLKAGICTTLLALKTLDRARLRPRGDIVYAFIGDEESGEPGSGVSAGMKALVQEINAGGLPRPDFAIYVEPTQLNIYSAQMGFLIADIRVIGRSAYFGVPELGVDALKAAHRVLEELWAHSQALALRGAHPLLGKAFVLVTGIAGGGYIAVPGQCTITLIRKLLPGEALAAASGELEAAARSAVGDLEIALDFTYPASRDHELGGTPCEVDASLPPIGALARVIGQVFPGRGRIEGAPFWSEASFLVRRLGVPTVYCAPGDIRNCHTFEERVNVEEYLAGVTALALFVAEFSGVEDA
jgi:acetylornithine deacetylase/succinyl-diaminopimelate desuccinylase-like protein